MSLGGDSDTIVCITGSIAHAFYGSIPQWMTEYCRGVLDNDQLDTLDRFCQRHVAIATNKRVEPAPESNNENNHE